MTLSQAVLTFTIAWWMILFMAAPVYAAKTTDENRKKVWLFKLTATTLITALVTWALSVFIASGVISVK